MDLPRRRLPWFLTLALIAAASPAAAAPQLIARMNAWGPPSWAGAIVPRVTADGDSAGPLSVSSSLIHGQPTYVNWSTWKNPAVCGEWTDQLELDEQVIELLIRSDCEWASKYFPALNQGPIYVRGGRHTLEGSADIYKQVANDYSFPPEYAHAQFVWSPMAFPKGVLTGTSNTPPARGDEGPPNSDGYQLDRTNEYAWVAGMYGTVSASDVDLVLYDDPYLGATSGFSHEVARSALGTGQVEFVVGGGSPTPTTVYPAVIRGTGFTTGGYWMRWGDAEGHRATPDIEWTGQTLPAYTMAGVYELYLTAGVPTPIDLTRFGGADDLSFSVFPPTAGGVWSRAQALANATPYQGEEYDAVTFTATETGWHPVVVYRTEYVNGDQPDNFILRAGSTATLGVDGSRNTPLDFALASANPASAHARFAFTLPATGSVRIAIHDAQGRRVRTLAAGSESPGRHGADWDLRDDAGARVGPGLYWATFDALGRTITKRLTVLR